MQIKSTSHHSASALLGTQIWLEREDCPERIDRLFQLAVHHGHGWARIFLNWSWIESKQGEWVFTLYDHAFDAAQRHGMRIKATLTANTPPWHAGGAGVLHSFNGFLSHEHRTAAAGYIRKVVKRYHAHPALGQWILWNEPHSFSGRTELAREQWSKWLQALYPEGIDALNRIWLTGYTRFEEVPWPEEVANPLTTLRRSGGSSWLRYRPRMDDLRFCADWLVEQLAWIAGEVRKHDSRTPLCANPTIHLDNQALGGTDLAAMARLLDAIGASYHPAWSFTFASRRDDPGLMLAGIRQQLALKGRRAVEVTELQSGNTFSSATRAFGPTPSELIRNYLACLAAGAESVTGWCFNARGDDFEAGDWSLLLEDDTPGERCLAVRRLADRLDAHFKRVGAWTPQAADGFVILDPASQCVEAVDGADMKALPGRRATDSGQGAGLLASVLANRSLLANLTRMENLPENGQGRFAILSHTVAWDASWGEKLLSFAASGGTVLWDGHSGRKKTDATLFRPWPGCAFSEQIGLRVTSLTTEPLGFAVLCNDGSRIHLCGARGNPSQTDEAWEAHPAWCYQDDQSPLIWSRGWGKGRLIYFRGMLSPSLIEHPCFRERAPALLASLLEPASGWPARPRLPSAQAWGLVIPVETAQTTVYVVLTEESDAKSMLRLPAGEWRDDWTDQTWNLSTGRDIPCSGEDGIRLLTLNPR
jgi:hypothetical protein